MKLIIKCDCGNEVELRNKNGTYVFMREIANVKNKDGFVLGDAEIEIINDMDEIKNIDDIDEISTKLNEIYIRCKNCNEIIYLDGWNNSL